MVVVLVVVGVIAAIAALAGPPAGARRPRAAHQHLRRSGRAWSCCPGPAVVEVPCSQPNAGQVVATTDYPRPCPTGTQTLSLIEQNLNLCLRDLSRPTWRAGSRLGSPTMVKVTGVDHYVLTVSDARASLAWYCDHLGLEPVRLEEWEAGEALVRVGAHRRGHDHRPVRGGPRAASTSTTSAWSSRPSTSTRSRRRVSSTWSPGPSELFGARGIGTGLYVRDPDGNVVELRHYADRLTGRSARPTRHA